MKFTEVRFKDAEVTVQFRGEYSDSTLSGIQTFIDALPNLQIGEVFYLGMWPIKIQKVQSNLALFEYDFHTERYIEYVDRALRLWQEQSAISNSQGVPWFAIGLDKHVFFTPSAFQETLESPTEGIRDEPDGPTSSGWFIYTSKDREQNLPFHTATLGQLHQQYNLNIMRFLGLPVGWMFNVDTNGKSYVWNNNMEETTTH